MNKYPGCRIAWTATLLFGSGCCALVYQMAWLRELRLVFGGSTAASGVVLAIFMGGLGLGSAVLGPRSDAHRSPLGFYAKLELLIALFAFLTPFLLIVVRHAYIALGGRMAMGLVGSTFVRIALAGVVLGVPTFLMGGTLPAAVKAVETQGDASRRSVGILYSANTLGAVLGVTLATFFLLERFGTRQTLWIACLLNVLIGVLARATARRWPLAGRQDDPASVRTETTWPSPGTRSGFATPASFVFAAACMTGFSFSVMELAWYRLLAPILGGSTYTFGVILIVALAGIGMGGGLYVFRPKGGQASAGTFALTCTLAALAMAIPFALGDRIAILTGLIDPLGSLGLRGRVFSWMAVAGMVVFPAFLVSGFQFPLLINLLGRGTRDVARHTGMAYAWNTVGAIAGALGGAFVLVPGLSAPVVWQMVVILLGLLGAAAAVLHVRQRRSPGIAAVVVPLLVLSVVMLTASGPTAVWRHSGIGAARANLQKLQGANQILDWANKEHREVVWEAEGREASVAIERRNGLTFSVNGKVDGNVTDDAMTQVALGLVGAALHADPRTSMVIGLGTGCSAGWLAEVESMERVDVVEIEPGIREMAERCAPANYRVLDHPKANLIIGDGREILLTSRHQYDLIVSEPSNPYRAGIASLYTVEFYRAVRQRMKAGAFFSQWLQAYEVDTQTVQTIYATLRSVFPVVELWVLKKPDLLFVCSMTPPQTDVATLRDRLEPHPFSTALGQVWRTKGLEGFLGHYVASPAFADAVSAGQKHVNIDNRMLVEYAFARTVGRPAMFEVDDLRALARTRGEHRPPYLLSGDVDWPRVDEAALLLQTCSVAHIRPHAEATESAKGYANALNLFLAGSWAEGLNAWSELGRAPSHPLEVALLGEAKAALGQAATLGLAGQLAAHDPVVSDWILARYYLHQDDAASARSVMERAIRELQSYPWAYSPIVARAFELIEPMVAEHPGWAPTMMQLLEAPMVVGAFHDARTQCLFNLALAHDPSRAYEMIRATEPYPPWTRTALQFRLAAYQAHQDPLLPVAENDLRKFLRNYRPSVREAWGRSPTAKP